MARRRGPPLSARGARLGPVGRARGGSEGSPVTAETPTPGRPAAGGHWRRVSFARVIFVTLVGYGGYLLADSLNMPGPWLAWTLGGFIAGVLAGFAVLELEHAARSVPLPRLFVGALGALCGALLAQLVAAALVVVLPPM